ncbi:bet1-like protein At1g29060 [Cucurbita pepo subsp. pepo]|uniref:Bet1-like protein At1g29060 n=1 Tax=Cucurbita maxima TaxID=3661 RepID=A0A6J1IFD8_CUCMA|nr:bet1-like protein At1g29060 [Cucurbita maxima]XP_023535245.1 bet1-like protein At1g29060 [Cucurbita pepo subsp. pepo]
MASSSFRGGSSFYNGNAAPYRSREGLSTRTAAASDEIQLQIDPMQGDLDDEIVGLHSQVKRLRNIAHDIGTEAKFQHDFLDQLQMTLIKAQAGVKDNVRRLNKKIIQNGSNHVVQVVIFALICFFIVYMWMKISRK